MNNANQNSRRFYLSRDEISKLDKDQLVALWYQQEAYINQLEHATEELGKQAECLQLRLQSKKLMCQKRLDDLCMKLTLKDREIAHLQENLVRVGHSQYPVSHQLESTSSDPAFNLMFDKMKKEVNSARSRVEEMQSELSAWRFTPDSATGKRLIAKCRVLLNENEEFSKEMSTGWVALLNGNVRRQRQM